MNTMVHIRHVAAAAAIGLIVVVSGAAKAQDSTNQDLVSELQIAKSLEFAIRDSEKLGLFTKLDIKNRFAEVRGVTEDFKRGVVAEYDLRRTFNAALIWLERVFASKDPALGIQLVEARTALWKIAVSK